MTSFLLTFVPVPQMASVVMIVGFMKPSVVFYTASFVSKVSALTLPLVSAVAVTAMMMTTMMTMKTMMASAEILPVRVLAVANGIIVRTRTCLELEGRLAHELYHQITVEFVRIVIFAATASMLICPFQL